MDDVVGDLPNVTIRAEEVEAEAEEVVDGGTVGVGAVEGVVRHAESDAGNADAEHDGQAKHRERGKPIRHDGGVGTDNHAEEEEGLQPHGPVCFRRAPAGLEIGRDTSFDVVDERRSRSAGKADLRRIHTEHFRAVLSHSALTVLPV